MRVEFANRLAGDGGAVDQTKGCLTQAYGWILDFISRCVLL